MDLIKGCGRSLHGPEPDARPIPGPTDRACKWKAIFQRVGRGRAGNLVVIFLTGWVGPANERWFLQWASKKEMSSGQEGPQPEK